MGLFSSVASGLGSLFSTGRSSRIRDAGAAEVEGLENAMQTFQPFLDFGSSALPGLQAGATPEGFAGNIQDITSSGVLGPLINERQRASSAALGSAGLTRSGSAATEAARIPTELLFAIEQLLSGRLGGIGETGFAAAQGVGSLQTGVGQSIANTNLAQAQKKTGDINAAIQLASSAGQALGGLG